MAQRIVIFGGTFDPVHHGHLLLARDALEKLDVDRVVLMPAPAAPLRQTQPSASFEHRVAMLQLAVTGEPGLAVSTLEGERAGPSYSHDTVVEFSRRNPGCELLWVIGADQLERLPRWHRIEELCGLVTFAIAARGSHEVVAPRELPMLRMRVFSARRFDVSASEIRERVHNSREIRWLLPDAVLSYIEKHALYRL